MQRRSLRFRPPDVRTMMPVQNEMLSHFKIAAAHQFLLHLVLHILNVNQILPALGKRIRDRLRDRHRRLRVLLHTQKGLAHRNLHFVRIPWHRLPVATN